MIMDERSEFCDATALNTGGAGRYLLGDVYDQGLLSSRLGTGEPLYLVISVDTTATSGGSATAEFQLVSDAQAAIATDGSATVHLSTGAIAVANLTAGKLYAFALPDSMSVYERYLGILQVTAVAAFTAGKINAYITADVPVNVSYPDQVK